MSKDADLIQTQCEACHLAIDRKESYTMFALEDCRSLFTGYLAEEVLPQMHEERYKLRKLATCYFLQEGILFKKGYDGDLLQRLGLEEAREIFKEVYAGEYREHYGRKKLY